MNRLKFVGAGFLMGLFVFVVAIVGINEGQAQTEGFTPLIYCLKMFTSKAF